MAKSSEGSSSVVKWVLILVGVGGVGLCVLGILAAIAVPAFIKYIKKSKASEASSLTKRIADEVRTQYAESCSLPPALPRHANPSDCCGGTKCMPDEQALQAWRDADIRPPTDPTYFAYSTRKADDGSYLVEAVSDFSCGGPMHTVQVQINPKEAGSTCTAEASPAVTRNEFE